MKNFYYVFILILVVSFISRLFSIYFYGDTHVDNEWGIILSNLENQGILGYREEGGIVFPTIYTPPLYPFFLYIIKIFFTDQIFFIKTVLYIQMIISIISIYFFYELLKKMFSETISLVGTIIFSLYPLNVYAVSQISSITLQVFFIVLFFLTLMNYLSNPNLIKLFIFSLISSALIYLRGEFFIIYFLTLFYIFLKNRKFKVVIISFLIALLFASPYLIRNYNTFSVITITKSSGYNLWRGNHFNAKVEGNQYHDNKMIEKIKNIKPSKNYDLDLDEMYMKEAIKNIKENPNYFLKLYFKKVFSFIFIDLNSTYENYYSYLNILPKIIISITTLLGILLLAKKDHILIYYSLYYFFNIFLFSLFFILPRYSLMLLPVQIILTCYLIEKFKGYLNHDNKKIN